MPGILPSKFRPSSSRTLSYQPKNLRVSIDKGFGITVIPFCRSRKSELPRRPHSGSEAFPGFLFSHKNCLALTLVQAIAHGRSEMPALHPVVSGNRDPFPKRRAATAFPDG